VSFLPSLVLYICSLLCPLLSWSLVPFPLVAFFFITMRERKGFEMTFSAALLELFYLLAARNCDVCSISLAACNRMG